MESTNPFPKRLKQAREAKGLSQAQLGERIGISASASSRMNHYEKGRHQPDFELAKRMADELGVPVAYFYCDSEEQAELLLTFYNLSEKQRKSVLDFVRSQSK